MLSCIAINMTSMEVWSAQEFAAFAEQQNFKACFSFHRHDYASLVHICVDFTYDVDFTYVFILTGEAAAGMELLEPNQEIQGSETEGVCS